MMGGVSFWQLLIIAIIIAILFGTNKLRTLGSDLGALIKGFKKEINDIDDNNYNEKQNNKNTSLYKENTKKSLDINKNDKI